MEQDKSLAPTRARKGRASRRRLQKMLEISEAEQELIQNARTTSHAVAASTPNNLVLPTDRSQVRQPVMETREKFGWKPQDEILLVRQLGFCPGNAIRVSTRVADLPTSLGNSLPSNKNNNDPVVLQLYPLAARDEFVGGKTRGRKAKSRKRKRLLGAEERKQESRQDEHDKGEEEIDSTGAVLEPFPTLYWLTHPILKVWVSKLEVQNLGTQLEARLQSDVNATQRMQRAHVAYGQTRLNLLTLADQQEVNDRSWGPALEAARGVAGIRNHAAVKCLHAHLAHYLSGEAGSQDNVVGQWVMEAIGKMTSADNSYEKERSYE